MENIAYQTDDSGYYIGQVTCQASPLEEGVYLIPRGATTQVPPKNIPLGTIQKFNFELDQWEIVDKPGAEQPVQETQVPEDAPQFAQLSSDEKKAVLETMIENRLKMEVEQAYQRLMWHDWSGTPLEDADRVKKNWALYRKELLAVKTMNIEFELVQAPEDFPLPKAPAMPPDLQ